MQDETAGSSTALAKLPLWNVIKLSYETYFENFTDVLRIVWIWVLVIIPVAAVASWLQTSSFSEATSPLHLRPEGASRVLAPPMELNVASHALTLITFLCGVGVAIAWHRKLILGERPGVSGSNIATRRFWRYILTAVTVLLVSVLPALVVGLPAFFLLFSLAGAVPHPEAILLLPLVFIFLFAASGLLLRFSLLLPARAVGNTHLTLRETWRATHGNTWRLFWGFVACSVLPLLPVQIVLLAVVGLPGSRVFTDATLATEFAAFDTLAEVYYLLTLPIAIGFLSHAYRYFSNALIWRKRSSRRLRRRVFTFATHTSHSGIKRSGRSPS